jgi:hypothetical protein
MPKKLTKRDHRVSSGKHKVSRIMKQLQRLRMKINRWERYQTEIKAGERKGKISRWNTDGLEKHMALLESLI